MEKINLSKTEKKLLRLFVSKDFVRNVELSPEEKLATITLQEKGLISAVIFADKITEGYPQEKGKAYVRQNPKLRNPIPLDRIIAIATLAAATIALFVGCVRLIATL